MSDPNRRVIGWRFEIAGEAEGDQLAFRTYLAGFSDKESAMTEMLRIAATGEIERGATGPAPTPIFSDDPDADQVAKGMVMERV